MPEFEIRYRLNGQTKMKVWDGEDGPDACERFAQYLRDRGETNFEISAWRNYPRSGVFPIPDTRSLRHTVIEPGHPDWGKRR